MFDDDIPDAEAAEQYWKYDPEAKNFGMHNEVRTSFVAGVRYGREWAAKLLDAMVVDAETAMEEAVSPEFEIAQALCVWLKKAAAATRRGYQ